MGLVFRAVLGMGIFLVFVFFWLWTVAEAIVGGGRLLAGVPGGWVCMESQV